MKKVQKHFVKRPAAAAKFRPVKLAKTPKAAHFYSKYQYVPEPLKAGLPHPSVAETERSGLGLGWDHPNGTAKLCLFLESAADPAESRPRGKGEEILQCLRLLRIPRKTILVTDGSKGAAAAVKELKCENKLGGFHSPKESMEPTSLDGRTKVFPMAWGGSFQHKAEVLLGVGQTVVDNGFAVESAGSCSVRKTA